MNQALLDYAAQIQAQEQQQQQQMNDAGESNALAHPFQSGVELAMQAARQSIGFPSMRQQRDSALNKGLFKFFGAMRNPARSQMEGLSNAVNAGGEEFLNQQAQGEEQNMAINAALYEQTMRAQQATQEYQRKIEEAEADRMLKRELAEQDWSQRQTMQAENLEEKRRYHDMMGQNKDAILELKRSENKNSEYGEPINGLYGIEYIPYDPKRDTEWKKIAEKEKSSLEPAKESIQTIKKMEKIFKEFPNVGTSLVNILEGTDTDSWWNNLLKSLTPEKERQAIQELKKLSANLNFDTIMGVQGKAATDMLKKIIRDSAPNGRLTYGAFKNIAADWLTKADRKIKKIKVIEDAEKRGMKPLFSTEEQSSMEEVNENGNNELSDEELRKIASQ